MKRLLAVCLVSLTLMTLTLMTGVTSSAAAQSEPMQKGISVGLAVANHAAAMPDADNVDAMIVTVTDSGSVYFGIDPITPAALAEKIPVGLSTRGHRLYIKADARTQYASLLKVLDAARRAGVEAPILLTAQPDWSKPGTFVPPQGLEVLIDPSAASNSDATVVQVLSGGRRRPVVQINNRQVPLSKLQGALTKNKGEKMVVVKADGIVPFAQVVSVIDTCRSVKATVVLVGQ